jgi:hypothetical protein
MIRIHKGREKLDKSRSPLRVGPEERTSRRCDMRIARYIGIVHCPGQSQWLHKMSGGLRASIISGVRILAALLGGRALGGDRNMKIRYMAVVLLALSFLLNGCAATLKLERDKPGLAETVGISPSEVKFISYCGFVQTTKEDAASSEYYTLVASKGVVLLTDTHLYVLKDDGSTTSAEDVIQVAFSDLSGVALTLGRNHSEKLIAYQLQFLRGEQVLVVQIGPKIGRDDEIQLPEAQQPFDLVLAAGVPKWESEKFFALDVPFRWDLKTGFAAAVGVVLVILLQVLMYAPLLLVPL